MDGGRQASPATRPHKGETPAALIRRVVEEACNNGRLAILDAALPPRPPAGTADEMDRPAWVRLPKLLAAFREAVPDARWTIAEQITEGDTVMTRLAVVGTFSGSLLGLAPPGRPATLTGVAIGRFAEGRLIDLWLQADLLGLLEQLRVLPPLGLTQAAAMARVQHAGALLAGSRAPPPAAPHRARTPPAHRQPVDDEHW